MAETIYRARGVPTTTPDRPRPMGDTGESGTVVGYLYRPQFTNTGDVGLVVVGPGIGVTALPDPVTYAQIIDAWSFYDFGDSQDVYQFLIDHASVPPLLIDAIEPIKDSFGEDIIPVLEIFEDIDSGGRRQLFVLIPVPRAEYEVGLSKLRLFDQSWFLEQVPKVAGKLNFDLEFV